MTQKRVKASDVIGNSYYIYTLESSNNTPALNGTINITCNVTNVYGQAVSGKSITLYQNNTSKGAKTTDSSGNASWNSISMSSAGLQVFKVENSKIEVFVDNKSDVGHTHSQYLTEHQSLSNYVTTDDSRLSDSRTPTSHAHGNLQNNGQVGSTAQANKNVVTNSSGLITTEDKPTIPSASSTTPSADTENGSVGTGTTWARSNHTHPKSSLYAESSHTHTDKEDVIEFITGTTTNSGNVLGGTSTKLNSLQNGTKILYKTPAQSSTDSNTVYLQLTLAGGTTSQNYLCDATGGFLATKEIPANTVLLLAYVTSFQSRWQIISRSNDATTNSSGLMSKTDKAKLDGLSNFSGSYNDLTDKPTIPTATSDLTNDSGFLTSHQSLSGYLQTSDVKDNLTSTDTDKPLSAKQGKELKALIDNKEDNIYRIVGTGTQIGTLFTNRVELQGTFPFDSVEGKIIVYVVPDISSLSEDLLLDFQGTYPSGSTVKFNIRKSNDASVSIGEIQTGDELLLFYDNYRMRLIGNSSISGKEDKSNKVNSWSSTTTDSHYPSEKLVKDSLDSKLDKTHTSYKGKNVVTNASTGAIEFEDKNNHTHSNYLTSNDISGKIDTAGTGLSKSGTTLNHSNSVTALTTTSFKKLKYDSQGHITGTSDVSASDLPTHTHSQYLTSHQDISGKEDSSNKVSSWSSTTNNIRYPTEKLVKDSLDGKADNNHTHEVLLSSNDDSDIQLFNVSAQGIPQGEGQSLGAFLLEFWKKIYPIGSIYMNVNNVDPAILFGGQWEQIEDMFLLASGSTYENGTTGGSADATLVSHQHGTSYTGEYFVTSENSDANNTRVTYSSSGNRHVDGMTASTTPFHHRIGTGYVGSSATGKNMPPYLAVNVWKRTA